MFRALDPLCCLACEEEEFLQLRREKRPGARRLPLRRVAGNSRWGNRLIKVQARKGALRSPWSDRQTDGRTTDGEIQQED